MVCGTDQSVSGLSLRDSPQTGHADASTGNDLAPTARFMETVGMASERSELICPGLSAEATETIINSRVVSKRHLYAVKWKLFTTWCRRSRRLRPFRPARVQDLSIVLQGLSGHPFEP